MIPSVCRVCKTPVKAIFKSVLLQKYSTQYYHCNNCGYVQTGEPFWLEEAYNMPINKSDTGMIMRNYWFRNITGYTKQIFRLQRRLWDICSVDARYGLRFLLAG